MEGVGVFFGRTVCIKKQQCQPCSVETTTETSSVIFSLTVPEHQGVLIV